MWDIRLPERSPRTSTIWNSKKKIDLSESYKSQLLLALSLGLFLLYILGNITRWASKRRRVLFAVVWSQTAQRGVVCYHISDPLTRRPVDLFEKEPLKGNSEVHLHTPTTRRDAVARIRLLDAVAAKQKAPFAAVWREAGAYNIVESESDLFEKRTPQGQFRGPPTYSHQVWWRSVKGPRRR